MNNNLAQEIAKMEYERLSKEIVTIQDEINQLARYAVVSAIAICSVILVKYDLIKEYYGVLKVLPFITVLLFGFRAYAQYSRLEQISAYIENSYESKLLKIEFDYLGWESLLNTNNSKLNFHKSPSRTSMVLFWLVLMALGITFILI